MYRRFSIYSSVNIRLGSQTYRVKDNWWMISWFVFPLRNNFEIVCNCIFIWTNHEHFLAFHLDLVRVIDNVSSLFLWISINWNFEVNHIKKISFKLFTFSQHRDIQSNSLTNLDPTLFEGTQGITHL